MTTTHKQANTYKELCAQADSVVKKKPPALPPGWTVAATERGKFNFKAVAYTNGNEIVISFVGTDPKNLKDHGTNIKMGFGKETEQMRRADEFYGKINAANPNAKIILAGHSEGGTEATYVAIKNNVEAVTFNAYGLKEKFYDRNKKNEYKTLITNYCGENDPVSKLVKNPGETYVVESIQNKFMKATVFGMKEAHGIDKMGDCEKSLTVEEHRKQKDPNFVDNVSEVDITQESIGELPPDLYEIYQDELYERIANQAIPTIAQAQEKTLSGGTVWVDDYTRADGTPVKGYYRRLA